MWTQNKKIKYKSTWNDVNNYVYIKWSKLFRIWEKVEEMKNVC